MSFDTLVTNPGRLRILTALAVEESQDFVGLRKKTQLTDGNLSSHARRLREAGLVMVEKTFRNGKPVTNFTLTPQGRQALESHVRKLLAAISQRRVAPTSSATASSPTATATAPATQSTQTAPSLQPMVAVELPPVMDKSMARRSSDALSAARPANPPMVRVSIHPEGMDEDLPPEDYAGSRTPRVVRTVVRSVARPVMMDAHQVNGSAVDTQPVAELPAQPAAVHRTSPSTSSAQPIESPARPEPVAAASAAPSGHVSQSHSPSSHISSSHISPSHISSSHISSSQTPGQPAQPSDWVD